MNLFRAIKYQLYLLQLENYELGRYFKLLFKKGLWPKGEQRKNLVWTSKAAAVLLVTEVVMLGFSFLLARWLFYSAFESKVAAVVIGLGLLIIFHALSFVFLAFANILLMPVDWLLKQFVIIRAKSRIKNLPNLKIVGIAGSYGKTTMKEVLLEVLGAKFNTAATPESINTPVGIARWILKKFNSSLEVAIIEMGEHYRGDIEDICKIVRPDIAVVTGINESHLERMKNLDNVVSTIFEIVSGTKPGGMLMLNGDDKRVMENYKQFVWPDHKVQEFKISDLGFKNFNTENLNWEAEVQGIGKVQINLLGEYALGDIDAAVKIAKSLSMSSEEIIGGIKNIQPVQHRLQPIKSNGNILVIDDAYNGNPDGVKEAIKVLSRFEGRRKVFVTPGLVEMGKASEDVHRTIGKELVGVADVVVLIKNSVTPFIEQGARSTKLQPPAIMCFSTAQEAHSSLGQILRPNDVVVFQNDWGDQYL